MTTKELKKEFETMLNRWEEESKKRLAIGDTRGILCYADSIHEQIDKLCDDTIEELHKKIDGINMARADMKNNISLAKLIERGDTSPMTSRLDIEMDLRESF